MLNQYKEEVETLKRNHMNDMLEKDEKIIKLTRETRELDRKY